MNNRLKGLEDVKAEAEYITTKRIREYQEKQLRDSRQESTEPVKEESKDEYTAKENKVGVVQYRKNGKLISQEEYEQNS